MGQRLFDLIERRLVLRRNQGGTAGMQFSRP